MKGTHVQLYIPSNVYTALVDANAPSGTNTFVTQDDLVLLSNITVVANYSALPPANTVSGKFYFCESSQGTNWLPGSLGGTYYSAGLYYSNGVTWITVDIPYQATQAEVDAGINNTKFVTPLTLANFAGLPVTDQYYTMDFVSSVGFSIAGTTHNIGRIPDVTLYDNTGQRMFATEIVDKITFDVTIAFKKLTTGTIILT